MREIPILFAAEMVEAIKAGRKTVTRRIVKEQPISSNSEQPLTDADILALFDVIYTRKTKPPYGLTGDLLYVKESFTVLEVVDIPSRSIMIEYADETARMTALTQPEWEKFSKWKKWAGGKSSLFMFKSLSRIWLQRTTTAIERLQDITEQQAIAEGVEVVSHPHSEVTLYRDYLNPAANGYISAKQSFHSLFCSIHGKEIWNQNPWVWAIGFETLSITGKTFVK